MNATLERPVRENAKANKPAFSSVYRVPRETPLWRFLVFSVALFGSAAYSARWAGAPEPPIQIVEMDLSDVEGVEPAPAELPPEPPPVVEPPPIPEAIVPPEPIVPEPEPEPVVEQPEPPPPEPQPEFIKPVEPEPEPTPPPKVKPKPKPQPKVVTPPPQPRPVNPAPSNSLPPAPSTGATGKGKGSGKGDFVATPHPQYDRVAQQRGYQGSGQVMINYQNGSITSVSMSRSTGVSYLDTLTTSWVKRKYRLKSGVSGKATFSIRWKLP